MKGVLCPFDRETNLKVRQALEVTAELADDHYKMAAFDGNYGHLAVLLQGFRDIFPVYVAWWR